MSSSVSASIGGRSEDEFDREQLAALELVTPHLQTALYTRRKLLELESRVSDMETALDHLHTALVLVDATAKVLFANRNARAIVDCRDGLVFCRGELIAQEVAARTALRAMLATAVSQAREKVSRAQCSSLGPRRGLCRSWPRLAGRTH